MQGWMNVQESYSQALEQGTLQGLGPVAAQGERAAAARGLQEERGKVRSKAFHPITTG